MKLLITFFAVIIVLLAWTRFSSLSNPSLISANGLHWHPELAIFIHGEPHTIPHDIGLLGGHRPIHTHEDLPKIHMEFEGSVYEKGTVLGKFFEAWNVPFNSEQIFNYQNGPEGRVHMFVNGKENTEFEQYHMRDGDRIEIRYE